MGGQEQEGKGEKEGKRVEQQDKQIISRLLWLETSSRLFVELSMYSWPMNNVLYLYSCPSTGYVQLTFKTVTMYKLPLNIIRMV